MYDIRYRLSLTVHLNIVHISRQKADFVNGSGDIQYLSSIHFLR